MEAGQSNRNISQYAKGSTIFEQRTRAEQIGLVVKGRVTAECMGAKTIFYSGSFLGIQDVFAENYLSTYKALDDVIICLFDAKNVQQLNETITANPDYCGLVIASTCKQLNNLYTDYETMLNSAMNAYNSIKEYGKAFEEYAFKIKLEKDSIPKVFGVLELETKKMDDMFEYYNEMNGFTLESIRSYFSQGKYIVQYHMKKMSELYRGLMERNREIGDYLVNMLDILIGNSPESIFNKYAELALLAENRGKSSDEVVKMIDRIIESINQYQDTIESVSSRKVTINRERMEAVYCQILSGTSHELEYEENNALLSKEEVLEKTAGALDILLGYTNIDHELAVSFKQNLQTFSNLRDKMSIDDGVRALRRKISEEFYLIYESVFLKAYQDTSRPLVIEMFLNFGFADERLLEEDQIYELYKLGQIKEGGRFKVYTIYEWLCLVYEGKKLPSKNEFDQDYSESLREQLAAKKINQAEYQEQLSSVKLKLHYEIQNFFRYISRIVNGRITTFVPIMHKDIFGGNMERLHVGAHKIEAALQKIMDIDYSLFYREVGYVNREAGIEKEYIMQEVLPEFILIPTVGVNGTMWQTISEKDRTTPARFILPLFAEINVQDMIMKISGKFRWEMCRTIQGNTWNNIKYRSLTSEYSDYIQFYRKNHELSEERKDKIKAQLQKCNNRTGDVFTLDYEAWIKGESQGAVRLNKVVRRIMAMYCPFEKDIRVRIAAQPLFADSIQAYELERMKKVREISNHYKSLQNNHIELTKELIESLEFYQEM